MFSGEGKKNPLDLQLSLEMNQFTLLWQNFACSCFAPGVSPFLLGDPLGSKGHRVHRWAKPCTGGADTETWSLNCELVMILFGAALALVSGRNLPQHPDTLQLLLSCISWESVTEKENASSPCPIAWASSLPDLLALTFRDSTPGSLLVPHSPFWHCVT